MKPNIIAVDFDGTLCDLGIEQDERDSVFRDVVI